MKKTHILSRIVGVFPYFKKSMLGALMFPILFSKVVKKYPTTDGAPGKPLARLALAPRVPAIIAKKITQ